MNPVTLFPSLWHRRAASITLIGSAIGLALFGYVIYVSHVYTDVILLAGATVTAAGLIASALSRAPTPDRPASWLGFTGFVLAVAGCGLGLLMDTSYNIHVIFVLLLSIFTLIAGLYGPLAWIVVIALIAPYATRELLSGDIATPSGMLVFGMFYVLPLVSSWLLWHGGSRRHGSGVAAATDTAYSTLASQLDKVASEADIVINTINDGVITLNAKGEIRLINPAAESLLGWNRRDSIGLDYRSVLKIQNAQGTPLPDDANPVFLTLHTGKPREQSDMFIQTASNKSFQTRISVMNAGAADSGVIVVFRDITAEKAEEREQAEFVSTASHEMRTPVAAIEGYLGLALNPSTAAIDDKARLYLNKAHESAQHLGRLFQDLLDVTKVDDGRLRNQPAVTDMVALSGDIVSALIPKAQEKGLTLTFAPAGETERKLAPVYYADIDGDHFREVLNNLVDNAIKYTKAGSVTVNISGDNDSVDITVKDSGIGIPREDISHLFQKFYRVDSSDTREIGGTGLGLYLSRRLVELMNGRIWVDSDYGHGSTFTLSVPRLDFETAQVRLRALAEQRERTLANEASRAAAGKL